MTLHAIIDGTMLITVIAQAVAYRRLQRRHIETIGALWAATLERK